MVSSSAVPSKTKKVHRYTSTQIGRRRGFLDFQVRLPPRCSANDGLEAPGFPPEEDEPAAIGASAVTLIRRDLVYLINFLSCSLLSEGIHLDLRGKANRVHVPSSRFCHTEIT